MGMGWNLALQQRHCVRATNLAEIVERESRALSGVHRRTSLHVRQREVALAVAAIGGAEQRKQRRVLRDRHKLPVAERPAFGREVERENADLRHKRIHMVLSWLLTRENAEQRDDEIDA